MKIGYFLKSFFTPLQWVLLILIFCEIVMFIFYTFSHTHVVRKVTILPDTLSISRISSPDFPHFTQSITDATQVGNLYTLLSHLSPSPTSIPINPSLPLLQQAMRNLPPSCPAMPPVSYLLSFYRNKQLIEQAQWQPGGWCSTVRIHSTDLNAAPIEDKIMTTITQAFHIKENIIDCQTQNSYDEVKQHYRC